MTEIWVPKDFTADKDRRVLKCLVCEAIFEEDQIAGFTRHVSGCAKRNDRQIEEELNSVSLARQHPDLFGPESGDVELEKWFKENREAILEYRLKP